MGTADGGSSTLLVCQVATGVIFLACVFFVVFPVKLAGPIKLNYVLAPPLGVLILYLSSCMSIGTVWAGIRGQPGSIEPYSILLLLYGLAYGCISLDVSGILSYIAVKIASRVNSPARLYFVMFWVSGILTIFTSNDVVILTFTPIVCRICATTGLKPQPFLISMFFSANIWSCFLVIGNPTNVIVGTAYQLSFAIYTAWCGIPTILAGVTAMIIMAFVFRKSLFAHTTQKKTLSLGEQWDNTATELQSVGSDVGSDVEHVEHVESVMDQLPRVHWVSAWLGCALLFTTLCLMFGLSFIDVPVWVLGLAFGGACLLKDIILDILTWPPAEQHDQDAASRARQCFQWISIRFPTLVACVKRLPPDLIPFMLGMFVLVEGLKQVQLLSYASSALTTMMAIVHFNAFAIVLFVAVVSALLCSLMNNLPMTILCSTIIQQSSMPSDARRAAMLALALGSNFGALLTFVASLAGIMFLALLRPAKVTVTLKEFMVAGAIVLPPVLLTSGVALAVEVGVIPYNTTI